MPRAKSVIPPAMVEGLQGSLAQTYVLDIIQFLHVGRKSGELLLRRSADGSEARIYFVKGGMVHAVVGELGGIEALVEVADWNHGSFRFSEEVLPQKTTIDIPVPHALMEVARILDEREKAKVQDKRREGMARESRTSTDVLEDFLKVPGVMSAVVVGRDGFLIESVGASSSVAIENLGASLAHAVNGIEEMGGELQVSRFQDLFVEYGRAVIMCRPAGDAIIAVVAPDASKLGIIRHKVKPLVDELAEHF